MIICIIFIVISTVYFLFAWLRVGLAMQLPDMKPDELFWRNFAWAVSWLSMLISWLALAIVLAIRRHTKMMQNEMAVSNVNLKAVRKYYEPAEKL